MLERLRSIHLLAGTMAVVLSSGCSETTQLSSSVPARTVTDSQTLVPIAADFTSWGNGAVGQLGNGRSGRSDVPVSVDPIAGVSAIAGGGAHGLLIAANGTVWAWGWNKFGQLGDGTSRGPQHCPLLNGNLSCSTMPVRYAQAAIFEYIEIWYNRIRRHSTLDYRSREDYESSLPIAA